MGLISVAVAIICHGSQLQNKLNVETCGAFRICRILNALTENSPLTKRVAVVVEVRMKVHYGVHDRCSELESLTSRKRFFSMSSLAKT